MPLNHELVLETDRLVRCFGTRRVLDQVTLAIPRGGIHALVGRNGAGKSTLYRVLLGFLAPTSGTSRLLGEDSTALSPAVRGRIGYVHESHPLPGWMRVDQLVALTRAEHRRFDSETFDGIVSLFALDATRFVHQLSRGERAGLALALALAPGPELLLLDEPTLGLDVVASRAFLEALLFAGDRELGTIVLSSHQMAEVERVAERLIVFDRGAVVADSTPEDLRERISGWVVAGWPNTASSNKVQGLLDARRIDDTWELVALDAGPDFATQLRATGATSVRPTSLGFERAMDAFLQGMAAARRKPTPAAASARPSTGNNPTASIGSTC